MSVNSHYVGSSVNKDTYVDLLNASVEDVKERPDKPVVEMEQFFSKIDADSESFQMTDVSSILDLPKENEDEDSLPTSVPAPGRIQTFNVVNYRQKVQITDTFMNQDRHGKGMSIAAGLPKSAQRLQEYLRTAIFDNAFTGTAGVDGAPLVDDSHDSPQARGPAWDNEISGALTRSTWQSMRLLADKQTDEYGYAAPQTINRLLIPADLRQTATELKLSDLDPETSLNTKNVLVGFEIVIGHSLSSTTAFFGVSDQVGGPDGGLYRIVNEELNIKDAKPSDNPDIVWAKRSKMILTYGFTYSRGIYGSVGT